MWPTMFLMLALASRAASLTGGKPGCKTRCGDVDIPYPFGIAAGDGGVNCSLPGFEISCTKKGSSSSPVPMIAGTTIVVLDLLVMPRPVARVLLPIAWQCFNNTGGRTGLSQGEVRFNPDSMYRISDTLNELFVLGCNTMMYTNSGPPGRYGYTFYTGCVSFCSDSHSAQDGKCAGVGCCHVNIPPGLSDNWMKFGEWSHANQEFSPCDYAFIVEKDYYTFRVADLTTMSTNKSMPLWLDWAIRDGHINSTGQWCATAAKNPGYTCVSDHSECVDSTNGPGYFCNCTAGFEGNPYVLDGCTNMNECSRPNEFPCHGECHDTDGGYDCKCRSGYWSRGDPKVHSCNPKFPLASRLAIGIGLCISLLTVAILLTLVMLQKRKLEELFEKNGGKKLENVKGLIIFSKKELNKITKSDSEFIGKGSFGKVYKGTLPDNTVVAVKASIEVNEGTKDEFAKEVEIQTQMIHKNILKLFGCCLKVDVPMLVYEFATNGSLQQLLHGKDKRELPLDIRLEIAIGSAEGLKYMHSYATQVIRHGDIKPDNILLDDKLTPKISDFGLSMLLDVDQYFAKIVVGCMGYIDPVFIKTGLLTQKSDVYSFGAVLLELITRKQNVFDGNHSLIIEFRKVFEEENSGMAMFDRDIATEEDIPTLEEIGKLALECLRENVEDRPDMTEVTEQLVMIRRNRRKIGNSPRYFDSAMSRSCAGITRSSSDALSVCPPQLARNYSLPL